LSGLPGEAKLPEAEAYGKTLERQFREAFPTTAFAGGLGRALSNGGANGLRHAEALSRFLDVHTNFELLNTPVDDFLQNGVHPDFEPLAKDEDFRLEVKAVQRVFKLAPTFEATDALLVDGVHSAQKAYRMGETEFVRRYAGRAGFTTESARLAWNRAADTHAAVLTIVADLKALEAGSLPQVLKNGSETLSTFPNWNNLFKTGDLCECKHCHSVLSPAAYFADLLMFLKERKSVKPPPNLGDPIPTVKDILFDRRPDLGFLELNCENALTILPYIDVVCEVLEDVIAAGENDLELAGFTAIPADPVAAKTAVEAAFSAQKINLGADFSLSQVAPSEPDRWVAHGDDVTYLLKKNGTPNFFAEILRNTKTSAAELRAYPQYVNPKAYEKLRAAKYPSSLPFDLFAEEVRAAFQKSNLQRWDLMRTLRGAAPPNNPSDGEIAAEYFGVSAEPETAFDEKRLILTPNTTNAGQQAVWGEPGDAGWLDTVGNVETFLRKTGLEYNELLALLDLQFINPTGDIVVHHLDASCDTCQKVIQTLDVYKLDRIHRFLRLWRKLEDWKMWELDLVIRHPAIGNGTLDEAFLIQLFYFSQLKNKLGRKASVEHICALFGDLNIETHFTRLHEKREDAIYQSLYLNRRLIHPLDPDFQIDPGTGGLSPGKTIAGHHPVVLAALGIRESDLVILKGLTKASDGTPYIVDDALTLGNLSFLWRHSWLAKTLKFKAEEWKSVLEIFQQDTWSFANPQAALEFLEGIDHLKATGFKPDELNWLLAADRSAKAAVKEADAARFLIALRKELQAIEAEHDPSQYDFLSVTPPTDVDQLTTLLTSLLQKLNRDEAEVNFFLATLRGSVLLEANVQGLPAGFAFPAAITGAPNHIPILYDEPNNLFHFRGLMTDGQRAILLDNASPALTTLRGSGELEADVQEALPGFVFPTAITGAPNHIPIQHDEPNNLFRFTGLMTDYQQATLLTDASLTAVVGNPAYRDTIEDLYQQSLKVVTRYRTAIEELYQQSLEAMSSYLSMETNVALPGNFTFPATITGAPNAIPIRYEQVLRFAGVMTDAERNILLNDPSLAAVTAIPAYRQAIEKLFKHAGPVTVTGLPDGFTFPAVITDAPNNIPISYDQVLRFTGLMTAAQHTTLLNDPSLAAVTGIPAYQDAIDEWFEQPRLALKFYDRVFTAPLKMLPPEVDFTTQLSADLAAKIAYDSERKLLRFVGIMRSTEHVALRDLSDDVDYVAAVDSLAAQPRTIGLPDERIWLTDNDLDSTQPDNDTLAKRLANAAKKALDYLSKTLRAYTVVQQSSAQLGLTEALTRHLLTYYEVLPIPPFPPKTKLLPYLTNDFVATSGVVNYDSLKPTFDGWFWANRVAAIWKEWKITLADLEKITTLTAGAQLLGFETLPPDDTGAIASIDRFLRTSRLLRLRDRVPETKIALLEVLEKLDSGVYAATAGNPPSAQELFAEDVQRLNETWLAADVEALTASLDLTYPADYLLPESWERLRKAFYFLDSLNTGADTAKDFASAAMTEFHAQTVKELLRSKFGAETWLMLSAEIQDVLRERKRDALAAYLLTQPKPDDAPSGKWENPNDLYAYYLLDVEMSSCQLTSRLVQGSGSVQLFVQRCFMGLEPDVVVNADGDDGDSAWRWWKWMRKYRVWEANRKVFLWPENWIEPELKKDRSQFFKDLENELLQNEINQHNVETAFLNYLEKLDGVAQLEIAGFYQEDDGDNAIIHVFGRTPGAEPHLYYYRRYDYRQWTPWEKVDLDIKGDYLIPAVINKRLFLFWPVFTEIPDETENTKNVPIPKSTDTDAPVEKAKKRLRLQMAVSDYRQGKWTPKRVSTDFHESLPYNIEITKKHYRFFPIDGTEVDSRFAVLYGGTGLGSDGVPQAELTGAFEITGCKGEPERRKAPLWANFKYAPRPEEDSTGLRPTNLGWVELDQGSRLDQPHEDFTLQNYYYDLPDSLRSTTVLMQTPGIFNMTPPWHLTYMDKLRFNGKLAFSQDPYISHLPNSLGCWSSFFYSDKKRTFFVLPSLKRGREKKRDTNAQSVRYYYPDIKKVLRQSEDFFEGIVQNWVNNFDLVAQRQQLEQFLHQQFREDSPPLKEVPPSYTDEQVMNLLKRYFMRFFHFYLGTLSLYLFQLRQFHFKNYYHPFVCDFARLVYNPLKGIPALMSRETQLKNTGFSFSQSYQPEPYWVVKQPTNPNEVDAYPKEVVDFSPDGAYSSYNWELFFHAPLLIADSLSKNQRFEEARDWYHFIFNPVGVESAMPGGSTMSKYWITKPFFETTDSQYVQQRIDNIMRMLAGDVSVPGYSAQAKKNLEDQVLDWRTNPFEPHRIANYRTVAYQKTVVMKYLDNLIAWGDNLFRQDSMESINEATQLYILAAEILGPRPKIIPSQAKPPLESFNELEQEFDKFSNALVEVENLVPPQTGNRPEGADPAPLPMLYFCIPQNDKMLGYWDTVADRLYKIRHCMNIEGVVRQLALFEPPIDPAALVKAVAGGVDISSALADLNAPLPLYRFNVLLQKANEVCNDVKALGSALLAALEKKDAEALGLLRQSQEIRLLEAVKAVREDQINETNENLAGVKKSKELAEIKKQYYKSREFMNAGEIVATVLNGLSILSHTAGTIADVLAGVMFLIPDFKIGASGFGGSPHATVDPPTGTKGGKSAERGANGLYNIATILDKSASLASTIASYQRRQEEWDFQRDLADKEIEQTEKSIAAAELRVAIAEKEKDNHIRQIENAKATDDFMRSKYTNEELYQWQVGQISGVYFQSYKLAYDLAKRAERCFRFELGLQDSSYINFGYWDSLKKGLLSGEKLQYDLRRLEAAYLDQNRREFELTKHISLALLDPLVLIKLRETGRCFFKLPEEIFDLDFPGHYFRRIKSVSLTLPCIVGPYTTISCTLRLLKNSIRVNTANGDNGYPRNTDDQDLPASDDRFVENNIPVKAIAASNAQNDSGVFELSFRDERYLPFEGAGAISEWSLELFSDLPSNNPDPGNPDFGKPLRQFDYSTISDAILHVKYTAREDAGMFKNGAVAHLRNYFSQDGATHLLRMFSLRQEFPNQWHSFLRPANPADGNIFEFEMTPNLFPALNQGKTLKINTIWLMARCMDPGDYGIAMKPPLPTGAITLARVNQYGDLHFSQQDVVGIEVVPADPPVKWQFKMTRPGGGNLQEDPVKKIVEVEDVILVLGYEWK